MRTQNSFVRASLLLAGLAYLSSQVPVSGNPVTNSNALAPLNIVLPTPMFRGTPDNIELGDRVEKPSDKPRPPFMAPRGSANVAFNKKVTSSDKSPITGTLDMVTDSDKEASDTSYVELHRRTQWVQIDLEHPYNIHAIVVWHAHNMAQVYRSVVVQVADDADFTQNVRAVFNNDMDNANGLGIGTQMEYFESFEGKLIDTRGEKARYVRLYSRGSTSSALNRYTEVEVYGTAATKDR